MGDEFGWDFMKQSTAQKKDTRFAILNIPDIRHLQYLSEMGDIESLNASVIDHKIGRLTPKMTGY